MNFVQSAIRNQIAAETMHAAAMLNPCKGVTSKDVRHFFEGAGFGVFGVTQTAPAKWQINVTGAKAYRAFKTANQFSQSYPGHDVRVIAG